MARGKTLWEMLTGTFQGPVEFEYSNPLHAKIGSSIVFDDVELRDYNFFVREIREYKRVIGSNQFTFVDYVILARPLNKDDVLYRLRLNPSEAGERTGEQTHNVLLLRLEDELAYNQDFHNVVRDTTKKFEILQDGKVTAEYWRINDVSDSYEAKAAVIRDSNKDRKIDKDEVTREEIEYWDYWRETPDIGGQPSTEFLFVEMDKGNGWFQIWAGREIDARKVAVL